MDLASVFCVGLHVVVCHAFHALLLCFRVQTCSCLKQNKNHIKRATTITHQTYLRRCGSTGAHFRFVSSGKCHCVPMRACAVRHAHARGVRGARAHTSDLKLHCFNIGCACSSSTTSIVLGLVRGSFFFRTSGLTHQAGEHHQITDSI